MIRFKTCKVVAYLTIRRRYLKLSVFKRGGLIKVLGVFEDFADFKSLIDGFIYFAWDSHV